MNENYSETNLAKLRGALGDFWMLLCSFNFVEDAESIIKESTNKCLDALPQIYILISKIEEEYSKEEADHLRSLLNPILVLPNLLESELRDKEKIEEILNNQQTLKSNIINYIEELVNKTLSQ